MDFIDQIKALGEKVSRLKDQIQTEEATKNAFIMPFIQILGYDVFNPMEVIPEFVADLGIKKGEKVDYCILKEDKPIILIECKWWGHELDVHSSQLHRYFHTTAAKFGILTNGIVFRFYTDLMETNKMDDKPFLEFSIIDLKENLIEELKKFHKSYFNIEEIVSTASELKYSKEIRNIISNQLVNPSEDFVRFFTNQIYSGRITSKAIEQFTPIVKKSINQFIADAINDRLKSALHSTEINKEVLDIIPVEHVGEESKIITTEVEMEAYFIVKSLLRNSLKSNRITFRDSQAYFSILIDDNRLKPVCRFYLNSPKKCIGLFDDFKKENKVEIVTLDDIYNHSEILVKTALRYNEDKKEVVA